MVEGKGVTIPSMAQSLKDMGMRLDHRIRGLGSPTCTSTNKKNGNQQIRPTGKPKAVRCPWHSNSHETGLPGKRCKDTADSDTLAVRWQVNRKIRDRVGKERIRTPEQRFSRPPRSVLLRHPSGDKSSTIFHSAIPPSLFRNVRYERRGFRLLRNFVSLLLAETEPPHTLRPQL